MTRKKFYITTAIDYVNSLPHIGTAYEKIGADVMARFKRLQGYDVHFQMGSDEHSVNVQKAAEKARLSPKNYCDLMRKKFEATWEDLNISYDGFIQTSEKHHETGVQKFFEILYKGGAIYKAPYKGWYCESCEAFYTEKDLAEGLCSNHKSKPKWIEEENYFFKLSEYQDKIHKHIQKNPEFILPTMRRNEILRLIEGGLQDVSISRSSFDWGIPLPMDKSHVVYVWIDALVNYITAVGFPNNKKEFKKWWPADIHVIGKDITRFHCVIWPAMLMAAKIPLPKTIFGHGFVYLRGEKMSKTLGNVVTPMDVVQKYGADSLRYYLLRTSSFGADGDFTWEDFIRRYNGDLANGIGNLVSRTLGMIDRYFQGKLKPVKKSVFAEEKELVKTLTALYPSINQTINAWGKEEKDIDFHHLLASLWNGIAEADRFINKSKPWDLAKQKEMEKLNSVLYHVVESLRIISIFLFPFIPTTAEKIWNQLGFGVLGSIEKQNLDKTKKWGEIKKPIKIQKAEGLFPRIEPEEKKEEPTTKKKEGKPMITLEDFSKLDLRVAQILEAEKVEGADKLLKLKIDLGEEKRQIVAGIAERFSPTELIGKKIVVIVNLKPTKIRGVESQGMLLAAGGGSILTPLQDVPVGSQVR